MSKKIKVGITINADESQFFNNGLHQNAYNLHKILKRSKIVRSCLVYPDANTNFADKNSEVLQVWGERAYPLTKKIKDLDMLLQVSFSIPYSLAAEKDSPYAEILSSDIKLIKIEYGNKFMMYQEEFVFSTHFKGGGERPGGSTIQLLDNKQEGYISDVWISPHFAWQKQFMGWLQGNSDGAKIAPYIWSPDIIKISTPQDIYNDSFFIRGDERNKKIIALEPNINALKTSLIPMAICETLFREDPEKFKHAFMFCAGHFREDKRMTKALLTFEAAAKNKITFEARYRLAYILQQGKLMIHHQFLNALNYTMLEANFYRLPLVHNSNMMESGYFYEGSNVYEGARQTDAALHHEELSDAELDQYDEACDDNLWRYSIDNPDNLKRYEELILGVINKK